MAGRFQVVPSTPPFQAMSLREQWMVVLTAFVLKPVYMVMALGWIVWLWRQRAPDLSAVRRGLIWFWLGENGCSISYLFFKRDSDFWEFTHGYGMAVGFGFIIYGLLELVDERVVKLSPAKERCAALGLCGACVKYAEAPCGLRRFATWLVVALIPLALLPVTAGLRKIGYRTEILGTSHTYGHLLSCQMFENWACPAWACAGLVASWLFLRSGRPGALTRAKICFAAALGPLSFGCLRLFLVATFSDRLWWMDFWEEATEFLFLAALGLVFWLFRHRLFGTPGKSAVSPDTIVEASAAS